MNIFGISITPGQKSNPNGGNSDIISSGEDNSYHDPHSSKQYQDPICFVGVIVGVIVGV